MRSTDSLPALLAAIAASVVTSAACKKTPLPTQEDPLPTASASADASAAPVGRADWTLDEMKEVKTTSPVDAIAVYVEEIDPYTKKPHVHAVVTHGKWECDSHADAKALSCSERFRLEREQEKAKRTAFALVARGDRFEAIPDEAAFRALLGEIDTPMEAHLLASFVAKADVWSPQCTGMSRTIVMEKAEPAGYAMKMQRHVRFGTLKAPEEMGCKECMIVEQRKAVVRPNGDVELGPPQESEWVRPMGCGRSPGWDAPLAPSDDHLARMAHLEAASASAFERIAEELEALGAPADLVIRARRAANDERAHARIVGELARARGVEPAPFITRTYDLRDAFALALDNAVEGCVNETFGALLLHVQALTAKDEDHRRAFAEIAADEAEHAELSRDLATWLDMQLSPPQRAGVARESTVAWAALAATLERPLLHGEDGDRLGLPDAATARELLSELARVLGPVTS